jgi:tryptophan synthase alpha chain
MCRLEGIIPALESSHAAGPRDARLAPTLAKDRSCWSTSPAAVTRTCTPWPKNRDHILTMAPPKFRLYSSAFRRSGRKALIPFITAGDPDPALTVPLLHTLVRAGADIIELGVPFSDPMADGPTIQRASERALAKGVSLREVLELVAEFPHDDQTTPDRPDGLREPDRGHGRREVRRGRCDAGVDGVLVVDYPPEESDRVLPAACSARNLDPIFLLRRPPTKRASRRSVALASGYVYYVSLKGVTGAAALDVAAVAARIPQKSARTGVAGGRRLRHPRRGDRAQRSPASPMRS